MWCVVFLDQVAFIIGQLMVPDLATKYFGGGADPCVADKESQACKDAVNKVLVVTMAFGAVSAILSLGFGPLSGAVADKIGTKPVLITSLCMGQVGACALTGFAYGVVPLYFYLLATELAALVPSKLAFSLWITERTSPHGRTQVFARLFAALGLQGIVAPLVTAALPPDSDALVVLLLSFTALLIAIVAMPGRATGQPLAGQQALPVGLRRRSSALQSSMRGLAQLCRNRTIRVILLASLIGGIVAEGCAAIFLLYLKEKYGMDMKAMAPVLFVLTLSAIFTQLFLVKPLEKRMGLRWICLASCLGGTVTCTGYLLAPNRGCLLVVALLNGMGSLAMPGITALLTNVGTGEQGEVGVTLGTSQSLLAVSSVIGPLIFRGVFRAGYAGAPWILAIVLDLLLAVLIWRIPASSFPSSAGQ